jgi:hypothetical protein
MCNGFQRVVCYDNGSSISKKWNKMQAEKKNPSDPDAVVTADAGAVLFLRKKPWGHSALLSHQARQHVFLLIVVVQVRQAQAHTHLVEIKSALDVSVAVC